ncbi:MAG: glycosyltransferase family 39 protein [Acidobacteria bacterium]|nr:glycosyltransferase family 39 protein [Acidobacteriota bacterium]
MKRISSAAVLALCAFSLLWRIDGSFLWRDEATTACWAREMVEHRWLAPRVFNGQRLIAQAADGHDFNDRFQPVMQGWLQFYVAALGFLVAGVSTASARMPFVLAGALSLWILYQIGRRLSAGWLTPLAAPVAGATSIYFLTAARQCRYYILVILFTCAILLELARYLEDPERARRWGFYLRLGLWGLLLYLANYVSFGGLWISLTVFVLLTRDHAMIRRFLALSALLAVPLVAEFLVLHSEFVAGSVAAQPPHWIDYADAAQEHGTELFRMIPLAAIGPAAWYVFRRRKERGPAAAMALLSTCIVVISAVVTAVVTRTASNPRYYFQVVPAVLLLTVILAERLSLLAGRGWAAAFFLFCLAWPNLSFYLGWSLYVVERQLTRDHAANEPIVEYLQRNLGRNETVAFYRNTQAMMAYFYLPWMKWTALLDSDEARNRRRRGLLPDYLFDDYDGVDVYVLWDNGKKLPRKLTGDYRRVWQYSYIEPKSWWDRHAPDYVITYQVYRRARK